MPWRFAFLALTVPVVAGFGPPRLLEQRPPRPSALDLLDHYERGNRDAVAAELAALARRDLAPVGDDLRRVAPAWIDSSGEGGVRRRRLVAATVALELAFATSVWGGQFDPQSLRWDDWGVGRILVEWGCALIRQNPPGEVERLWQLASVAIAEGAGDSALLTDVPWGQYRPMNHLRHARDQFPADPRFRLAQVVALEYQVVRFLGERTLSISAPGPVSPRAAAATALRAKADLKVQEARRAAVLEFERLADIPGIGAEAHLHLGYLRFLLADPSGALAEFKLAASRGTDPFVRYLAFFLAGRMLDRLDQSDDAEMSYVLALRALPHVQSGTVALATKLFLRGKSDEAHALVDGMLTAEPPPADPWRLFAFGDLRSWPELIRKLRANIQ